MTHFSEMLLVVKKMCHCKTSYSQDFSEQRFSVWYNKIMVKFVSLPPKRWLIRLFL